MKKLLTLLLVCLALPALQAQKVYEVSYAGPGVEYRSAEGWKPLSRRELLSAGDSVRLTGNTSLSVIDNRTDQLYAYGRPGSATLAQVVGGTKTSVLKRFVDYVKTSLKNGSAEQISLDANVIYRGITANGEVYAALKQADFRSGYLLSLELVDPATGAVLGRKCPLGQRFIFRVTNHASEALLVNVLGIDSGGELYDCLPVDEALTMLHLQVPAGSTVDFSAYPLEMTEPAGAQRFVLLAAQKPFDLRRVIFLWQSGAAPDSGEEAVGKSDLTVNLYK